MTKDDLLHTISIYDVLSRYGYTLSRNNKMLCPFHNEKTASFTVYDNNTFYCFGCGTSGNIIDFVKKLFNLDFKQAVSKIKIDFGILDGNNLSYREKEKMRERIRKINEQKRLLMLQKRYTRYAYHCMCCYRLWLLKQEKSIAVVSDIEYVDRLLDKYLLRDTLINFDVKALLTALIQKHKKRGRV